MRKLAIITTHPIQYYAPVFRLLQQRGKISIKVFYTWGEAAISKYDPGFGKDISWDIPLTEDYPFTWVRNVAANPGSHYKRGIINPTLISEIKQFNPSAILVFGWAYQSHFEVMRYFHGKIPVYFRGDSTLLDEMPAWKKTIRYIWLKWVYHFINNAFYVGTNNRSYFKLYGLKDEQLAFAPHAIDNERFAADCGKEARQLREQLNLRKKNILILFAGKLEDKKSPLLLLEAFLDLQQDDVHLLITGNGQLEATLKASAAESPNIHFLNFQNQQYMPVIYQAADLFCLPSQGPGETWGLAVNEAMAAGAAIVVSDKVGCATDLVTEKNGAIFTSGDLASLTKALKTLTADKQNLKQMGKHSKVVIAAWNFTNIAEAFENKLLNEKI
ncbi:MAG: glycosyl transferase family 1 [Mucilaginibacter sp.]|nr:glycosyl transferase family 1 [Mucilaginibacter sp.]